MYVIKELHPGYLASEQYVIEQVRTRGDYSGDWLLLDAITGEELQRFENKGEALQEIEHLIGDTLKIVEAAMIKINGYVINGYVYRIADDRDAVNYRTIDWIVPPKAQGQIVEYAYGWDEATDKFLLRMTDHSEDSVAYYELARDAIPTELEISEWWDPINTEPRVNVNDWIRVATSQQQLQTQHRYVKERRPGKPGKPMPTTEKPAGKLKRWLLTLMNFPEEAIKKASVREAALRPRDKKVIHAFLDHEVSAGHLLSSDGAELIQTGLGGDVIARWGGDDKIVLMPNTGGQPSTRTEQSILRYLKQVTPSNWLTASCGRQHDSSRPRDRDSFLGFGKKEHDIAAHCLADMYGLESTSDRVFKLKKTKKGWEIDGKPAPMDDGEAKFLIQECSGKTASYCSEATIYKPSKGATQVSADEVMDIYLNGGAEEDEVNSLVQWFNGGAEPAEEFLREADSVLKNFGIEALNLGPDAEKWELDWDEGIIAEYSNCGDTYCGTFLRDLENDVVYWTTWGDFLEAWEHERREELGYDPFHEEEEAPAPDEDDLRDNIAIQEVRKGYDLAFEGKYFETYVDIEDALREVKNWTMENKVYLDIYYVNERGNIDQIDEDGNIIESWV